MFKFLSKLFTRKEKRTIRLVGGPLDTFIINEFEPEQNCIRRFDIDGCHYYTYIGNEYRYSWSPNLDNVLKNYKKLEQKSSNYSGYDTTKLDW